MSRGPQVSSRLSCSSLPPPPSRNASSIRNRISCVILAALFPLSTASIPHSFTHLSSKTPVRASNTLQSTFGFRSQRITSSLPSAFQFLGSYNSRREAVIAAASMSSTVFPTMQSTDIAGVYERMKREGKGAMSEKPPLNTPMFLLVLTVGLPVWLGVLLPLTVTFQICSAVAKLLGFTSSKASTSRLADPGEEKLFPETPTPLSDRTYDVVIVGATGYTGQMALEYMLESYGVNKSVKWAIAGRSQDKLKKLKSKIADKCNDYTFLEMDTIVADSEVRYTLHDLVKDTRVVLSFAGPFAEHGSQVVEFCARYGTHYADITGEVGWNKEMMALWESTARKTGAKLISFCGFDCIPWDMTVHRLAHLAEKDLDDELVEMEIYIQMEGGVSGGTIASLLFHLTGQFRGNTKDDPYLLQKDGTSGRITTTSVSPFLPTRCPQKRLNGPQTGTAPFVFSIVTTDVVRRSNVLRGVGAGIAGTLQYRESTVTHDFKTAVATTMFLGLFLTALANPISATLLRVIGILPQQGQGPSEDALEKGYLTISGFGVGRKGGKVESVMYFPVDAGYRDTARMAVESALCLALDGKKLASKEDGGFFTTSTGMGDVLLERLCQTGTAFASCATAPTKED